MGPAIEGRGVLGEAAGAEVARLDASKRLRVILTFPDVVHRNPVPRGTMPSTDHLRRCRILGAALLLAAAACTDKAETSALCSTQFDYEGNSVSGWSTPAAGTLTLTGHFYPDETVKLEYDDNIGVHRVANGTPATERSTLTFTGLPSGQFRPVVTVSCPSGLDETHANGNFFIL